MDPAYKPPKGWREFNPSHIALLYLKLESEWKITVNHACYPQVTKEDDDKARLDMARAILIDRVQSGKAFGSDEMRKIYKHEPFQHKLNNAHHQPGHEYDGIDFGDFGFASQNELFIFLHHPGIDIGDDYHLISFGESGRLVRDKIGRSRDKNFSFFNSKGVREAADLESLKGNGQLIRLRNYQTLEKGGWIQGDISQSYSMNIHFEVDGGTAGPIAMIIDPDTGNGAGNEP